MAIIYLCRECSGRGKVKQKRMFMTKEIVCPKCKGTGKLKTEKLKKPS
ncbi:hypothetical protein [Salisediminibacterium halotolerans]|uniref:Uncharacterized protein n=1 Tax=Salisediminibacterium halotolerans TaxID=517425 RepID=A0A1H9TKF4_9BACI|nr:MULTISPECIES: hypothetical protein [Salisediminibacterium]RLJ72348.1 hypothetical protein BCL39_2248 [Actinophytocola xinjiangensis]RPE85562.1 hypothetical protein EDD67_2383 [Salisediminibacterium halotolerans]TWG33517.1 hypothetical protein BCL52_2243 [Salisediminibacterium halotolerans]SER97760.1 hypothetical protein SAMN05444126_11064 [Salisediminibacterium haloalkalitolerans]GEL08528.1 hypothetical protein SHA02_19440 [Salisediminibacterium halotolerans]